MGNQSDWHFCSRCHEMVFNDKKPVIGRCAGNPGGGHQIQGFNFFLPTDVVGGITSHSQDQWNFCTTCNAMVFRDKSHPLGKCPGAADGHHPKGSNFFLPHDVAETPTAQGSWRFCVDCHALFFNDNNSGKCPAHPASAHVPLGLTFVLPHNISNSLSFDFPVTFPGLTAVGGNVHLDINSDGFFNFTGHFHNSGFPPEQLSTIVTVKDSQNRLFAFAISGSMGGTIGGSRDFDFALSDRNQAIADFWVSIAAGAKANQQSRASLDIGSLAASVKEAAGDVSKVIEVVGPVLAAL
jgi:hypothetical protein